MEVNGRTYCPQDIAQLEAELKSVEAENQELVYNCRDYRIENAKLKEAVKEYSYNEHFPDCKINNPNIRRCNCGYEALAALTQENK